MNLVLRDEFLYHDESYRYSIPVLNKTVGRTVGMF